MSSVRPNPFMTRPLRGEIQKEVRSLSLIAIVDLVPKLKQNNNDNDDNKEP
jgi:hypothetical protein